VTAVNILVSKLINQPSFQSWNFNGLWSTFADEKPVSLSDW